MIPPGKGRAPVSWPRVNLAPHACYLYGRERLLECASAKRGLRLHGKKLEVFYGGYPVSAPSLSAKDEIIQEILPIMTPIQCPSVVFVTLCLHLTRRPDHNTAAAPCNMAVDDHEFKVMLMCYYPQCGLGPDTPEGDSSCLVPCCTQYEFSLRVQEVNHLRLVSLPIVCAAPFRKVVPSCEELTGVYPSLVTSWPSAVLGTVLDLFLRRADPPRATEDGRRDPRSEGQSTQCNRVKGGSPRKRIGPPLHHSVRKQDDLSEPSPSDNNAGSSFQ